MSAIDVQNTKQIRAPMLISCGIAAKANISISISDITGFPYADSNASTSLRSEDWPMKQITDLQEEGFLLDGSCSFYSSGAGSADGKIGLRTHIGGTGSLTVSSASEIPSLTIYTEGEGTITANGIEYEARGVNIVPVNDTSISLTFESTDDARRMIVQTILPGINLSWDQDTLISCEVDLRSDLSITDAQWAVSEIEIQAYYPDDISEAVSGINDNVPIWYSAGYPGDMSPERRFYLSEPVTMEDGIITIKGRDASYLLGEKSHAAQILNTTSGNGRRKLYRQLVEYVTGSGIKLRYKEAEPSVTSNTKEYSLIFKSGAADNAVMDIMNLAHVSNYWPTFVDAGIPRIYHSKPSKKWDIYEEDCGSVARIVDRNIASIRTSDEYGLHNNVIRSDDWKEIVRRHCVWNTRYSQNAGGYFWTLTVSNAVDIDITAESIWWTAKTSTTSAPKLIYVLNDKGEIVPTYTTVYFNECVVKGKQASMEPVDTSVAANPKRAGITVEMSPVVYGAVYSGYVLVYPNYNHLFDRSNITGSFLWKGDPRMQPRDVFGFHRLDGTEELCTIESITLKHEGGGTTAEIAYRLGVC